MPREPLPEELRRFITTSVPSVPFVEALLLLRETPGRAMDAAQIARRIYVPERAVDELMVQMVSGGMAEPGEEPRTWRFAPAHEDLRAMLDMLAAFYRLRLVEVTALIHSRSGRAAQAFADAFKWKGSP